MTKSQNFEYWLDKERQRSVRDRALTIIDRIQLRLGRQLTPDEMTRCYEVANG